MCKQGNKRGGKGRGEREPRKTGKYCLHVYNAYHTVLNLLRNHHSPHLEDQMYHQTQRYRYHPLFELSITLLGFSVGIDLEWQGGIKRDWELSKGLFMI